MDLLRQRNGALHEYRTAPNEKHGQTNLQQCWMEQFLLDEIAKTPLVEVRYGHEVNSLETRNDGVTLQVQTAAGHYTAHADYLVAADGPRGTTRKQLGLDYEGTSYTQQFVINDIICKLPLPDGRRLFFNPRTCPAKRY
ncbi:FAD-dependent monooxygenase [Neopusillimonas aromaticivorans]|nr:FAD-dependent monooxygenase [Neopusillimonas aromaticivorans]WJJ95028.1 FAD-dependent monooxygenase [Neopusillimonas aromaticivorans]